ncbi:MAG: septum formation protein Maf [Planctomycetes bacterium]|nr:septum formation protein Maf [Planctomycetota bacterium]
MTLILLASASPRRVALLREAGLEFAVEPADVDETLAPGTPARAGARELALRKARAVAARHRGESLLVIGADTIVALGLEPGAELLGKAADENDERRMLGLLSGSRHAVVTGVAVVDAGSGAEQIDSETTHVRMRVLDPAEIEAYVASGAWRGKAGGYAIQLGADRFVTGLEGAYDNVVGLPVALTLRLLRAAGS